MIRVHVIVLVLLPLSSVDLFAQERPKLAVPDETERAAALVKVQSVYKEQYEDAKTDLQKVKLATTLLNDARATQSDPAARFAMLRVAKDIAAGVGHLETSTAAIEELDRYYDVDRLELEAKALIDATAAADLPVHFKGLAPEFIRLILTALEQDRFDVVDGLADRAEFVSRRARDRDLKQRIDGILKRLKSQQEAADAVASAREVLKEKPTDPEANAAVGKYLCFIKGHWKAGIPMLAIGDDKDLAELAIASLKKSATPLELGDRWWNFAEKLPEHQQRNARAYAVVHYRQGLASLDGFNQKRAEQRIKEQLASSLEPTGPFPTPLLLFTFDEKTFSVAQDGRNWIKDLSGRNHHAVLTTIRTTNGVFGDALEFKETESILIDSLRDDLITDRTSISICGWVRTSENNRDYAIFDVGQFSPDSCTLWVFRSEYCFRLNDQDFSTTVKDYTQWHHIAASWNGRSVELFIDGEPRGGGELTDFAINSKTITDRGARLGRHARDWAKVSRSQLRRWFVGEMDDFAIFAGPLTKAQVKAIYVKGLQEALK